MIPIDIINEFYNPGSKAHTILIKHGQLVAARAVDIACKIPEHKPDLKFIEEAAILHDIGIFKTNSPTIGCTGDQPYIVHGVLGREILDSKGMEGHGLVCERHVGVGVTIEDIKTQNLPLPERDMLPVSIEEQIICYADKFFSKDSKMGEERSVDEVVAKLQKYGQEKVNKFMLWAKMFSEV